MGRFAPFFHSEQGTTKGSKKALSLKLPRAARLTRRVEFLKVRSEGRSVSGPFFVLGVWDSELPGLARVGIITTRKTGGAVDRNRARRRLRELVRLDRPRLRQGLWLVLIARKPIVQAKSDALKSEWLRLCKKASILIAAQ